jgi:predicted acyl esterase
VTAYLQRCPREAHSSRPFFARTFSGLARGEVRARFRHPRSFGAEGGDPAVGSAIDPVTGGGDGCATTPAANAEDTASYRLRRVGRPFTLLGAPTIVARLGLAGSRAAAQVAARLWDVAPGGESQRLVSRGVLRPVPGRNVFQLNPAGWRFARGHVPKLELLGNDAPYGRASNGEFTVEVREVQLRLPVRQRPDCRRIRRKARPILPAGQRFAPGGARRPPGCRRR